MDPSGENLIQDDENSKIHLDKSNQSSISGEEINKIIAERRERLKELGAINKATSILRQDKTIDEWLLDICRILPAAWQYPESTAARIKYDNKVFISSEKFRETQWCQKKFFDTIDGKEGIIEIYYLSRFPKLDEGPFMTEERNLINNLSYLISGHLNTAIGKILISQIGSGYQGKNINPITPAGLKFLKTDPSPDTQTGLSPTNRERLSENLPEDEIAHLPDSGQIITNPQKRRQLLQKFLVKHKSNKDIYHDLMQYKVGEILLVANLYDAYNIEQEGRYFEQVSGDYYHLSLSSAPRITGVSTPEEALDKLQQKHYDLIIIMMGVDKKTPVQLSKIIKSIYHNIPVFLLLNNHSDVGPLDNIIRKANSIDKIFVWNGDSNVFLAMVKYIEDKLNVENDINIGMVGVILLVEDSPRDYSRYLPILYSIVIEQTQQLIEEENTDQLLKLLKMRVRPKILLAGNYTEALTLFDKYRENLLCLISDVKFENNGEPDENAGLKLAVYAKNQLPALPIVLQSSDKENAQKAYNLKTTFISKNSETLEQDIRSFINYHLGFGNFIYRDDEGRRELAVARTMKEFKNHLRHISEKSIIFHARKNHFSYWLMARGEIQIAKKIRPLKITDVPDPKIIREQMINIIESCLKDRQKGKVVGFEESAIIDETNVVSIIPGSLGGKGRGLAFICMLINNFSFGELVPGINIRSPKTSVIGTDEFDQFMQHNKLYDIIYKETDFDIIKEHFKKGELSATLIKRLKTYLSIIKNPLAVRSSSLFEDSLMQPFAGIFDTFLLPNNHDDISVRLEQLTDAIKLVFASIFSPTALTYFKALNYKLEEERMAVILQEVVGNRFENYFYPHVSGVAQSYNFYPYSYMKPDEGFAVTAVGLGKYVVEGEKSYRFSPVHPQLEIYSPRDLFKNSQLHFYAINMACKNVNLLEGEDAGLIKLELEKAEKHGSLKHCASVYDISNERTIPGLSHQGPRVINFANILKHNHIPMAKAIEVILDVVSEAMGSPVEIEFAIDLNKDIDGNASFYLLQVKPLIKNILENDINPDKLDSSRLLLYSENGLGNGIVKGIKDVVYVDMKKFDRLKTEKMRDEIEAINKMMVQENRKYILIGPGRWGSRDRFIGIPVSWSNISNAKIIVEVSMEDFPLDASLGSHFFHNVISMNVGYYSVQHNSLIDYINWEYLDNAQLISNTVYFRHVRFENDLEIIMDGKKRTSYVYV